MAAVLLPVLILIGAACEPGVPPTVPMETAGVLVVGDSITWQAEGYIQAAHPEWEMHTMMGWKMSDVNARIQERRADGSLGTLVVALGTNDANPVWNGSWTAEDENLWTSVLLNLHADTKLVLVKPYLTASADPLHTAEVNKVRAYIDAVVAFRPNTAVADWADYADAPGVTDTDGIHLAFDPELGALFGVYPEALAARLAVLDEGMAAPVS